MVLLEIMYLFTFSIYSITILFFLFLKFMRFDSRSYTLYTILSSLTSKPAGPSIPMDAEEAAQAIFPSMARSMQKYLRVTRQQPNYTMTSIMKRLADSVSKDESPRAFLQLYLQQGLSISVAPLTRRFILFYKSTYNNVCLFL